MRQTGSVIVAFLGLAFASAAVTVWAQPQAAPSEGVDFINTVTGEKLDFSLAQPEGKDTPAVKSFMKDAKNPYIEDKACLRNGQSLFLSACSGCHGHLGEGKIGPGLNDNYWTYPANTTDKGLFETIYGGANGQMGPHYGDLKLDEMLEVMSWVRHLYTGPKQDAVWLTAEQKEKYKPYKDGEEFSKDEKGQCKPLE